MPRYENKCHESSESSESSYECGKKKLYPCDTFVPQQGCLVCQKPYKRVFKLGKRYNNSQLYGLLFNLETNRSEANYNAVVAYGNTASQQTGLRVLITLPDGTVVYDSSRPERNTYANFLAKTVNENHNTRPEIMMAQLSLDGIGVAQRYSSSVNALQTYVALRVTLKQKYYTNNVGTIRFSQDQNGGILPPYPYPCYKH